MDAMRMKRGLHMLEQIVHYREFFLQPADMLVTAANSRKRPQYHPVVQEFIQLVDETGFFLHYNWKPWVEWVQYYTLQPVLFQQASLLDLRKILSCCICNPRLGAGHLSSLLRDGSIQAIMQRLDEICQAFLSGKQGWTLTDCGPLPPKSHSQHPVYTFTRWCYWADPVRVLAGCYPGDLKPEAVQEKLAYLLQSGIGQVINLMEPDETDLQGQPFAPYEQDLMEMAAAIGRDVRVDRFPIPDMGVPTQYKMRQILDCVDGAIAQDRPVYVHCWGGHGRTGTVVGCYLARHDIAAGKVAVQLVQKLHEPLQAATGHPSPQDSQQVELIRKWQAGD